MSARSVPYRPVGHACGLAVAVLLGALAATACGTSDVSKPKPGRIVLQKSIDRASLRMTPSAVRARLGSPQRTSRSSESETGRPIISWIFTRRRLVLKFRQLEDKGRRLTDISTTSPKRRTKGGARVGISEALLRKRVSGLDCFQMERQRWCTLGSGAGRPQTIFTLRRNRVTEVRIILTF